MTSIKKLINPHKPLRPFFLILCMLSFAILSSCSKEKDEVEPGSENGNNTASISIDSLTSSSGTAEGNAGIAANADDLLANATFSSKVIINFGTTLTVINPLPGAGVTVTQANGDVTVNSTVADVEYELSGTTANGSVKIYSDKKIKLTLNGVNITNADGPAINIQSSKRVFLVLADNTTNSLTDGATYTASGTEDMKATLFSEGQLVFSGAGSLNIKANYKHAICSDEYVRVISGNIKVTGAVSDGIHTNDAFIVDGGIINITTAGDGIQCEEGYIVINNGAFTISAADKGIAATWDTDKTIDPYLTINGGTINITSSGGEGIETKSIMTINNGTITTKTSDDGLNAGTFIYINGGNIYAYSTSNDAIDSNGKITVTGGKVVAIGSTAPEEGFDCDKNTFKITGGILVGAAGATSSPTASVSTQASVILGSGIANQLYHIRTSDDKEVLTFLIPRNYATMLFSSPKLKSSGTYKVYTGGSITGGSHFGGVYTSGTYNTETQESTFTTNNMVTKIGGSIGPG